MKDARAKSEHYAQILTTSGAEVQTALSELRKAGLIKKQRLPLGVGCSRRDLADDARRHCA
jgi:predicted transcriptional regulator